MPRTKETPRWFHPPPSSSSSSYPRITARKCVPANTRPIPENEDSVSTSSDSGSSESGQRSRMTLKEWKSRQSHNINTSPISREEENTEECYSPVCSGPVSPTLQPPSTANEENNSGEQTTVKKIRKQRWLREIIKYQRTTNPIIPLAAFMRIVREIVAEESSVSRWQPEAVQALREASEDYLIELFNKSNHATLHTGRVTIMNRDVRLVRAINPRFRYPVDE
jgi:histone H3/H4